MNGAGTISIPAGRIIDIELIGTTWKDTFTDNVIKTALNASGEAPIYACRAWVNFNGTGTVAIRASGNVSSITDNGTGDYTVNFTTLCLMLITQYSNQSDALVTITHGVVCAHDFSTLMNCSTYGASSIKWYTARPVLCVSIFR